MKLFKYILMMILMSTFMTSDDVNADGGKTQIENSVMGHHGAPPSGGGGGAPPPSGGGGAAPPTRAVGGAAAHTITPRTAGACRLNATHKSSS